EGVNFTAGLNAVRTSPDHGTGYDIAGKNKANEQSFKKALYAAIDIFKNRKLYAEISENPLHISTIKKER
ncbi:MAG: 4-hydroxythreonine-4-phosphate dehydrogenase PdxA, partial [Bacteroidia bacterium]